MDTSIIVMTAIIIVVLLIPVVISITKSKNKKAQLSKTLNEIAGEHNSSISTYDSSRGMTFGITENNANFVFYKKDEENVEQKFFIPLHDVKSCELIKASSGSGSGGIGKLSLRFVSRDKTQPDVNIGFYDSSEYFQIVDELELIEKWKHKIDASIASVKETVSSPNRKVAV